VFLPILFLAQFLAAKFNNSNDIIYLSKLTKMPISKTSGIKTGELRIFEVQRLKIKPRYKISCDFCRMSLFFWVKIHKKL